jgi:hypothetical protein
MNNQEDIIGKRVGRLTVIKEDLDRSPTFSICNKNRSNYKYKLRHFYCKCDCGNTVSVRKNLLMNGKKQTKSCGCLQKEKAKEVNHTRKFPTGVKPLNDFIHSYKSRAKKRNYEYSLTRAEFSDLIKQPCYYCGSVPKKLERADWSSRNDFLVANGIDRINSDIGYNIKNVVPCCGDCNYAKSNLKQSEFFQLIGRIYKLHVNEIGRLTSE